MAKFARDYATLYQQEYPYPPVRLFTTHVDTFQINYYVPSEVEVEAAVRRLCPHKSGGHTHLRVEHFKALLREAYPVEGVTPPPTWKVDADHGHSSIYVEHRGYSAGIGVDHPGIDPQVKHRHPGDWTSVDAMEGCEFHHQ